MSIEDLLNQVEWHEIPQDERLRTVDDKGEVPVATHEGVLKIATFEFKVFQLSNGQRVIEKESMEKYLGSLEEVLEIAKKLGV